MCGENETKTTIAKARQTAGEELMSESVAALPRNKQAAAADLRLAALYRDCRARGLLMSVAHCRCALQLTQRQWQSWLDGTDAAESRQKQQVLHKWLLKAWVMAAESICGSVSGQKYLCGELARQLQESVPPPVAAALSLEDILGLNNK